MLTFTHSVSHSNANGPASFFPAMSDAKSAVAAMMKLPKAERMERLVAMSAECVARQEDAAPLLALIQLELDTPDSEPPASRPASTASSIAAAAEPKAKSTRRMLKEKRDELRAMLAKVDKALGSSADGPSSRPPSNRQPPAPRVTSEHARPPSSRPPSSHPPEGTVVAVHPDGSVDIQLAGGKVVKHVDPSCVVRDKAATGPSTAALERPPTGGRPSPSSSAGSQRGGRPTQLEIDALLRKAEGGKAPVCEARAAQSSMGSLLGK